MAATAEPEFGLTRYQLMELMAQRRGDGVALIEEYGGLKCMTEHLKTDVKGGIRGELEARRAAFGANFIPPQPPKGFLALCLDAIQDKTLIILIAAAIISIILGVTVEVRKDIAWVEGAAILAAVVLVVFVTAINDWTKDRQFRGLQKKLDTDSRFSIIRNHEIVELPLAEIVVGDIAQFKYGNTFPVDGVLIQGYDVRVDEASLTGEADLVKKKVGVDPMLLAGTQVMEGGGTMLVTAVGPYSQQGIIFQLMTDREDEAGFIVKGLRRLRDKMCGKCMKKPEEDERPLPKLQSTADKLEEGLEVQEIRYDPDSPIEEEEEEEAELKGLAKLNLVKRIQRRKRMKKRKKVAEGSTSTETGSVLQRKLDKLAVRIGYAGTLAAILCVLVLTLKFVIEEFGILGRPWDNSTDFSELLHFVIIGITVLVVAVPEGLPLAVTISLAYSVKKMLRDNNLVRHLHACETMGNATAICSDKTGTLTTNRMTVVESYFAGNEFEGTPPMKDLPDQLVELIKINICVNSSYTSKLLADTGKGESTKKSVWQRIKAHIPFSATDPDAVLGEGLAKQVGNVTECAMLSFLVELGLDYESVREQHPTEIFTKVFTFNSARKSMSTVLPLPEGGYRLYTKGASEIVLGKCCSILKDGGNVAALSAADHRQIVATVVKPMAGRALRTIALAYRDFPMAVDWDDEEAVVSEMVLLGIVGIQDPVRPEVPGCIRKCQQSGISVRMVTGDNVETARAIALKCGIIGRGDGSLVLEGSEFRKKVTNPNGEVSQEKLDNIWPRLRVLARSSPQDKHTLVNGIICSRLHKSREVVAVTGDGTNDGPALKRADVGFAMGIAGTDVAKEASDIILTDDNFASIVKAVSWGRNVYDSIAKFLQFQLTVNLVAVTLTLVSAFTIGDSPLRALQLLWVNLIMDTLASLALATERPSPDLLKRKPYGRNRSLISRQMWVFILGHTVYQLVVLFTLLFAGSSLLNIDDGRGRSLRATPGSHFTVIFNTFVFMQIFNELNARKIHGEWNIFTGIHKNLVFLAVVIGQVTVQALIVEFGDIIFNTNHLSADLWLWCVFLGSLELLVGRLLLLIPIKSVPLPWKQSEDDAEEGVDASDPIQDDATRAKILWLKSLSRLRTQIRVVNAFRQGVESGSMGALAQLQSTPRPVRHNRPVTGIETAV